ncbi:MAG: histidinol-phosphate aminotransferase [Roseivirga sp.]|jgi:histidinol-phosphate aminotransferase
MSQQINRRKWLKTGLMTIGGASLLPHLSWAETLSAPIHLDSKGRVIHTPLFKEYISSIEVPEIIAKLNANENPYGPSTKGIKALKNVATAGNRYGWSTLSSLVDKICVKEGVDKTHIMMGPGSSDLLEKTAMVMFMNGGTILSADPSYMSLMNVVQSVGGKWKGIPLKEDWSHDLRAMEAAIDSDTKLIYICNPNNPTGTITSYKELYDFCSRVADKVPIFIDEAYLDFVDGADGQSMVKLLQKGKNVIIARTYSKIHGMAGLRIGYIAALPETLEAINSVTRGGMGIANTTIAAANASMDDIAFQEKSKALNKAARTYTFDTLKSMGFEPVPSHTSFMIFPLKGISGKPFLEKMMAQGVAVRSFDIYDRPWCRVSMGTMKEMKLFIEALDKVVS